MKFNLSFAEIKAISQFLKQYSGGYIAKAYMNEEGMALKFRKSGIDSYYLHLFLPDILFLSRENRIENGKTVDLFEDFKIVDVSDPGTDRWILIQGTNGKISIELMGGGNLIVTEGDNIIFKIKEIKRKSGSGEKFTPPDIIDFTSNLFNWEEVISRSTGDPVRTLATRIGLSKYAEEAICRLGLKITNNVELLRYLDQIKAYSNLVIEKAREMNIFDYGEKYFVLESGCISERVIPKPVQEALEEIYDRMSEGSEDKIIAIKRDIERLKEEEKKLRELGTIIMNNFTLVQKLLEDARNGKLKQGVDFEHKKLSVQLDGKDVELDLDKSAGENANTYFDASKKIHQKLDKINVESFRTPQKKEKKKAVQRIFQNYRWFITSEGNLVLAGKDAETNDSVVKKYLDEKDIYLHADIHGAPSVVLKNNKGITEISINEAAQFAWCMSRAWNAGFGNGSVFYVTKSQVSKTPESGEYVPRGAWIIRGKKNYITHLELKLAIGMQRYQNRDYLVSAPPSALSEPYVTIVPGEEENLVEKISDFLNVEKEAIYPVLPPGRSKIEEFIKKSNAPKVEQNHN